LIYNQLIFSTTKTEQKNNYKV